MQRILAMFILLCATMVSAHAGIIISNFHLEWGTTNATGGTVIIRPDSGLLPDFEAIASNFEASTNNSMVQTMEWIRPKAGSGFTFAPVDLLGVYGPSDEVLLSTVGVLLTLGHGPLFSGPLVAYGSTFMVEKVAFAVPEPGTASVVLLALLAVFLLRRRQKRG